MVRNCSAACGVGFALLSRCSVLRAAAYEAPYAAYRDLWLRQYRVVGDGTQQR